jgi:hypothetical protein
MIKLMLIGNKKYRRFSMKKIFLILFVASAMIIAGLQVQAENGDEYIIIKDDTLWDISDSELEDSFLWPKLWSVNPHIENPDLIYPGERIRIPTREELMRMTAPPKKKTLPMKKMLPMKAMQKSQEKEPRHIFRHRQIEKKKYLVDKDLYITSGWIDPTFPSVGEVISAPMYRQIVGKGDTAYVEINKGYESAKRFFVIRDVKMVQHPEDGNVLGHQIRVIGLLNVTGKKGGFYETKVARSFEDIQVGDGLFPFTALTPPLIPQTSRKPSLGGYIVASHITSTIAGKGDIIFIDKGKDNGLQIGDTFTVLSEPPVHRSIGKVQLISLKPTTASAVVIESSKEISVGAMYGQE